MQSRHTRLRRALYACAGVFLLAALAFGASLLQEGAATAQIDVPGLPVPAGVAAGTAVPGATAAGGADAGKAPSLVECTLTVPALSLDLPVNACCDDQALKRSVCKFSGPAPGQAGNYVIVGHNYLSGAQFARLKDLKPGDTATLAQGGKAYAYRVYALQTVTPENMAVLSVPGGNAELTLLTCSDNNTKRLLVRCRLV
jgi:LPXTG-site transpeptidase (sortase) family protein